MIYRDFAMLKNNHIRNVPELGYIQYINLKTSVFNNKALLESQIIEIGAILLVLEIRVELRSLESRTFEGNGREYETHR